MWRKLGDNTCMYTLLSCLYPDKILVCVMDTLGNCIVMTRSDTSYVHMCYKRCRPKMSTLKFTFDFAWHRHQEAFISKFIDITSNINQSINIKILTYIKYIHFEGIFNTIFMHKYRRIYMKYNFFLSIFFCLKNWQIPIKNKVTHIIHVLQN